MMYGGEGGGLYNKMCVKRASDIEITSRQLKRNQLRHTGRSIMDSCTTCTVVNYCFNFQEHMTLTALPGRSTLILVGTAVYSSKVVL